jgi:hypothetical protein
VVVGGAAGSGGAFENSQYDAACSASVSRCADVSRRAAATCPCPVRRIESEGCHPYPSASGGLMALNVGDKAPDFEIPAVLGDKKEKFKLSDYQGKKNVVLAFYPLDWTPV